MLLRKMRLNDSSITIGHFRILYVPPFTLKTGYAFSLSEVLRFKSSPPTILISTLLIQKCISVDSPHFKCIYARFLLKRTCSVASITMVMVASLDQASVTCNEWQRRVDESKCFARSNSSAHELRSCARRQVRDSRLCYNSNCEIDKSSANRAIWLLAINDKLCQVVHFANQVTITFLIYK